MHHRDRGLPFFCRQFGKEQPKVRVLTTDNVEQAGLRRQRERKSCHVRLVIGLHADERQWTAVAQSALYFFGQTLAKRVESGRVLDFSVQGWRM